MSTLSHLLRQVTEMDPKLGSELSRQVRSLKNQVPFGLHFERHRPESVRLHGQAVRRGDKVHVLAPRGAKEPVAEPVLWRVAKINGKGKQRRAELVREDARTGEQVTTEAAIEDLVVVAEFRDNIYPGLVQTGQVTEGADDAPFHTVINGENYHALQALTYTHAGKVDAIYIDPPYNTGAKDWKYNNDYVEADDAYRHSKWLAFMERRLLVAKKLLNPDDSVLIVTIDEKEYLRLGMLLEQLFPEANVQMVTSVINPGGSTRSGTFSRTDEYLFFVLVGAAKVQQTPNDMLNPTAAMPPAVQWHSLVRHQASGRRTARPNLFYPIYISESDSRIVHVGESLPLASDPKDAPDIDGAVAVFPLYQNGGEGTWALSPGALRSAISSGFVRSGTLDPSTGRCAIYYLKSGKQKQIAAGEIQIVGYDHKGSVRVEYPSAPLRAPKTTWNLPSHNARSAGSDLLRAVLGGRVFPFPKSLYAVEDSLRFFIGDKPDATVLDFFSGSGTTAHAVMRLNKQDGGRRQCISVTNNEVSADEQEELRAKSLRPGDAAWEALGICDYVTKPRITAAITGKTPSGEPIKGDYKFTDEFPMSDGFDANARFFTLTYERADVVDHNLAFSRIAPLLWMRAGAVGRVIDKIPERGWDVTDRYGVLFDLDAEEEFLAAATNVSAVFVVTSDSYAFQRVVSRFPDEVDKVHLYRSYLSNFAIVSSE